MDSRYQRNIYQIVHKYHQIVHKFQKKYKYTCGLGVHGTYYVYSAGAIHGRRRGRTQTNHGRACILDDRDLERWSTSMWWGPAARLARPTDGAR